MISRVGSRWVVLVVSVVLLGSLVVAVLLGARWF
jgi:hypothetical protein